MKFIAKKDFLNVPALALAINEKTPGFVNQNHVHKGHRFAIGQPDTFKDLKPNERDLVVALISSESVVPDDEAHKADVAKVEKEVADDKAKAARRGAAKAALA